LEIAEIQAEDDKAQAIMNYQGILDKQSCVYLDINCFGKEWEREQ